MDNEYYSRVIVTVERQVFVHAWFNSFVFLQRAQSELAAHQKKILHVDNHIGISIAGLTADARLLW